MALLGSIASILGFLAQVGVAPSLAPLKQPVGVPLWLIIGGAGALPWIVSLTVRHAASGLADRLDAKEAEIQSLRGIAQRLEGRSQSEPELATRLAKAESRVASYEALEAEIMGLLNDAGEHSLDDIVTHTSIRSAYDSKQRVLRCIDALGDRIEGTGGVLPRYRKRYGA